MSGAGRSHRPRRVALALLGAAGLAAAVSYALGGFPRATEEPAAAEAAVIECNSCTSRHQSMARARARLMAPPSAEAEPAPAGPPP